MRGQRKKLRGLPPRFFGAIALVAAAGFVVLWKLEEGRMQTMKNELLGRQRAVAVELGPRWDGLRGNVETWTRACAAAPEGEELVARGALDSWDFRKAPGIYLRLTKSAASSSDDLRQAAEKSLHDGFTSCLLVADNPNPLSGPACTTTADCADKQFCNEMKHCAEHSQPYNLRLAYQSMRFLSDEWVRAVQEESQELALKGAVASFEAANKYDIPVAIDLLTGAQYFLVVVDEPPTGGKTEPAPEDMADAGFAEDQSIPVGPHMARVCLWRFKDGEKVLSVRREAAGRLMGGPEPTDARTRIAKERQASSCALALEVREAIGVDGGARTP